MKKLLFGGAAAALTLAMAGTFGVSPAQAEKHDSNTLHRIGNAIQYPIRKAGENASIDMHRGEGKKSVESDRQHNRRLVVTPEGNKIVKSADSARYAHHRRAHHVKHHRMHRHMMKHHAK